MSESNVGFATLQIIPSARGFKAALSGQTDGVMAAAGRSGGGKFSAAFGLAAKNGMVAVAAGIAAVGGLAKLGESFDGAFDTIRTKTGETGASLDLLLADFKATFSSVPVSMGDASNAIADINNRLDLTGKPLRESAKQFLNLSRVTGTDLSSNVEQVSRVFGDWGIKTRDQAGTMDKLFRASQASGVGIDSLSTNVVKFGAPLRQMGFGFEESIAMIGKFEKEGVNTELVMGSMRIALGKMAKAGEPVQETYKRITDEIKNAGSTSEANALALELFGARAGPDMAAAIREGRFELGAMTDQIVNGQDTINKAAADTDDWREKLRLLGNKASVALEPLASKVFARIGTAIEWATPYLEQFAVWLSVKLPVAVAAVQAWFGRVWPKVQRVIAAVVTWVRSTGWPILQQVFDAIRTGIEEVRAWWDRNWGQIKGTVLAGVELIRAYIDRYLAIIRGIWERWGGAITGFLRSTWSNIQTVVQGALDIIRGIFQTVTGLLRGDWGQVWAGIRRVVAGVWQAIKGIVRQGLNQVGLLLHAGLDVLSAAWSKAWGAIKALPGAALRGAASLISGAAGAVIGAAASIWSGVLGGAEQLVTDVGTAIGKLPGKILEWAGDFLSAGTDLGAAIVEGLKDGVSAVGGFVGDIASSLMNGMKEAWNTFANQVNSWLPDSIGAGPFTIDFPDDPIPRFHQGGVVPGRRGAEVPAVLQAGEMVLTAAQQARMFAAMNTPSPATAAVSDGGVHIGQVTVQDGRDLGRELQSIEWRRRARPKAWVPVGA